MPNIGQCIAMQRVRPRDSCPRMYTDHERTQRRGNIAGLTPPATDASAPSIPRKPTAGLQNIFLYRIQAALSTNLGCLLPAGRRASLTCAQLARDRDRSTTAEAPPVLTNAWSFWPT
jgi:hypothetical protein